MAKPRRLKASFAIFFAVIVGMFPLMMPLEVRAATPPASTTGGQALEIAPPLVELSANPGQTITTQILLRDVSSTELVVTGQANDFVAQGENGTPKILLNNNASNDPYSMKDWVNFPGNLLLVPKEIKTMKVTISVPANASPGGHYGVIRFTGTPPSLSGTGVSLSASVGTLVLLTVNGKITENMSVKEFSVNHNGKTGSFFESGPLDFVVRLNNQSNVHEEPSGLITVSDTFGKKIATMRVNNPPRNILPGSVRKFDAKLDKTVIGNRMLFGRYKATLSMTYGSDKKPLNATMTFWVIPWKIILIIIACIIVGFFALRFAIRRYNQRIISKSRHHRR
ncbi:MAG TPA: hypothetical protein VFP32_01175 [Candidatus Saccharimonadales bacterium]|nr:hypothetical protein [Candidatus Saccharimonadales bacterium]